VVTDMRTRFVQTASALLDKDERVAVLLAEISEDRFEPAIRAHPNRVIHLGIMEQTMIGAAAGFAMEGFHPIAHSITPFLVERPFEQIKIDFGYQGLGGTLVSSGGSYDYGAEGATHHSPGDVAALLAIPGVEVIVPGTPDELERLLRATYANGRLTYIRASNAENPTSFPVEPGRIDVVRRGSQATVLAVGPMLGRTLTACQGLDVTIAYLTSVSPFDPAGLRAIAGDRPLVITVEPFYEGTSAASLAAALADVPSRIVSIGVPRCFIHAYGTASEHDRALGLDEAGIRRRFADILSDT
jgi:transketolase